MTEIKSSKKQCRICLGDEHSQNIISPCSCSGSLAYVHRECLDKWRARNKNGRGFKACDICSFEYVIETIVDHPDEELKRLKKYYKSVALDLGAMLLYSQCVIIVLTYYLRAVDRETHGHYQHNFLSYYLYSVVIFVAFIGFITVIISISKAYENVFDASNSSTSTTRSSTLYFPRLHRLSANDPQSVPSTSKSTASTGTKKKHDINAYTIILLIIVVIFFIYGVFVILKIIKDLIKSHADELWLKQEVKKYIVKDFQNERDEFNDCI